MCIELAHMELVVLYMYTSTVEFLDNEHLWDQAFCPLQRGLLFSGDFT